MSTHVQAQLSSVPAAIYLTAQNSTEAANGAQDPLTATVSLFGYPYQGASIKFTESQTFPTISPVLVNTDINGHAQSYISSMTKGNVTVYASFSGYNTSTVVDFVSPLSITFAATNITGASGAALIIDSATYSASQLPVIVQLLPGSRHYYAYSTIIGTGSTRAITPSVSGCQQSTVTGVIVAKYNCTITAAYILNTT